MYRFLLVSVVFAEGLLGEKNTKAAPAEKPGWLEFTRRYVKECLDYRTPVKLRPDYCWPLGRPGGSKSPSAKPTPSKPDDRQRGGPVVITHQSADPQDLHHDAGYTTRLAPADVTAFRTFVGCTQPGCFSTNTSYQYGTAVPLAIVVAHELAHAASSRELWVRLEEQAHLREAVETACSSQGCTTAPRRSRNR